MVGHIDWSPYLVAMSTFYWRSNINNEFLRKKPFPSLITFFFFLLYFLTSGLLFMLVCPFLICKILHCYEYNINLGNIIFITNLEKVVVYSLTLIFYPHLPINAWNMIWLKFLDSTKALRSGTRNNIFLHYQQGFWLYLYVW